MHVALSLSLVKLAVQDINANGRYLHNKSDNTRSGAVYITCLHILYSNDEIIRLSSNVIYISKYRLKNRSQNSNFDI